MTRTIPFSATLVKEAAERAYSESLDRARELAAEFPECVAEISLAYDTAYELYQVLYYAEEAESVILDRGKPLTDLVLRSLIKSVCQSGADVESIAAFLRDWADGYVGNRDDDLSDSRMSVLPVLALEPAIA